ncbi:lytic transglycosylase domain-containing protein [Thermomonospora umbrina]|uniref:aggregation-promoting factor C-terminal-like domain-containing protein n=1 Tax=Thermomonospora umbrina TaxID=111806 RepID=UPI0011C1D037|nr:lytic transglycosylase domain-containing protein [Thermomonospora umbrina]
MRRHIGKTGQSTSMRHVRGETPEEPPRPPRRRPARRGRRLWLRILTGNVTITLVATGVLVGVALNIGSFDFAETGPPAIAEADLSADEMLMLINRSDLDAVTANAVAEAKRRAYEKRLKDEKKARERAEWYRKNRTKIEASKTAEALRTINPSAGQNKAYGKQMNALKGWSECWSSLEELWDHESGWNELAENPSSGAYGIPQALPASKLASAGSDWRTSSPTQIAWGLGYIKARYKDPCRAWGFWQANNWY